MKKKKSTLYVATYHYIITVKLEPATIVEAPDSQNLKIRKQIHLKEKVQIYCIIP